MKWLASLGWYRIHCMNYQLDGIVICDLRIRRRERAEELMMLLEDRELKLIVPKCYAIVGRIEYMPIIAIYQADDLC